MIKLKNTEELAKIVGCPRKEDTYPYLVGVLEAKIEFLLNWKNYYKTREELDKFIDNLFETMVD